MFLYVILCLSVTIDIVWKMEWGNLHALFHWGLETCLAGGGFVLQEQPLWEMTVVYSNWLWWYECWKIPVKKHPVSPCSFVPTMPGNVCFSRKVRRTKKKVELLLRKNNQGLISNVNLRSICEQQSSSSITDFTCNYFEKEKNNEKGKKGEANLSSCNINNSHLSKCTHLSQLILYFFFTLLVSFFLYKTICP